MSNHFRFVCPVYNAEKTIVRTLLSLLSQSYENWSIICIDDVSTDDTVDVISHFRDMLLYSNFGCMKGIDVDLSKFDLIVNSSKRWEVKNVLRGIDTCSPDDIVCRIDGDDWLTDNDCLEILDRVYSRTPNLEALWTAHRWEYSDKNISGPMPIDADVYKHPWVSSHLKTFRKRMIDGVPHENFLGEDGKYIRRAGDQAIYLPVLKRVQDLGMKYGFLNLCCYHYSILDEPSTYQTPDAHFQRDEALFIRKRGYVSSGKSWEECLK